MSNTIRGKCITPHWKTSTHDIVYEVICSNLQLDNIEVIFSRKKSPYKYLKSLFSATAKIRIYIDCWKKGDIREIFFNGINIGHSLNETAIANSLLARFKFGLVGFFNLVNCIFLVYLIDDIFKNNNVSLVLGGDEGYTVFSISAQLAVKKYNVPCFFLKGSNEISIYNFDCEYLAAFPKYENFKNQFRDLLKSNEKQGVELLRNAEKRLNERAAGIRHSLGYMPAINTDDFDIDIPKKAIWIYLHDFYDSPGIYGNNLFPDHYSWVSYTIEKLIESGAKIVMKEHPNQRPKNKYIIDHLKKKYRQRLYWCGKNIAPGDLKLYDCNGIITVYGSIIIEACFSEIPVISCARYPSISFDLSYNSTTLDEYDSLLILLSSSKLPAKIKNSAIEAEAAIIYMLDSKQTIYDLPFDDLPHNIWRELELGEYPKFNYERRDIFLKSKKVKSFMKIKLEGRNLADEFGIKII